MQAIFAKYVAKIKDLAGVLLTMVKCCAILIALGVLKG